MRKVRSEAGTTMAEFALCAALIGALVVGAMAFVGDRTAANLCSTGGHLAEGSTYTSGGGCVACPFGGCGGW